MRWLSRNRQKRFLPGNRQPSTNQLLSKLSILSFQGDSGGPLISQRDDKRYELIGNSEPRVVCLFFNINFLCRGCFLGQWMCKAGVSRGLHASYKVSRLDFGELKRWLLLWGIMISFLLRNMWYAAEKLLFVIELCQ